MTPPDSDYDSAIRQQLREQKDALAEIDVLIESTGGVTTDEIQQVRSDLLSAVQELEGLLQNGETSVGDLGPEEPSLDDLDSAADHAGLGFRDAGEEATSDEEELDDSFADTWDEDGPDADALERAALAMSADAAARARAAEAGPQTDTVHFASWEAHTRGVGSKLMAAMGYVEGRGLGAQKQGGTAPVKVHMLRKGAGLGMAVPNSEAQGKKRRRGGERARRRKLAEAAMAARQAAKDEQNQLEIEAGEPGIFAFINTRLTSQHQQHKPQPDQSSSGRRQDVNGGYFEEQHKGAAGKAAKIPDRRALAQRQDTVAALRERLKQLQQMAARNAKDQAIHRKVVKKIEAVQEELAAAEAASAHAHRALHAKEKDKKFLKF